MEPTLPGVTPAPVRSARVWLFDLDNTLHDASTASLGHITQEMTHYMIDALAISREQADVLRRRYWLRYGATLLGLVRHHGVKAAHFLHQTHLLPGLEQRLRSHPHDVAALAALPGRKFILTNAPRVYAERVLTTLGLLSLFDGVITVEDMAQFGHLRPKPDARMLRCVARRLGVSPSRCVLVEDTLDHLKAARRVGMRTVWMRRWTRSLPGGTRDRGRMPAYVDRKLHAIGDLRRRLP
jgi:putative hydrolase of the HAD superfamily